MSDKIDLYSDRGVLLKSDVDLSAVSPLKNAAMQRLISLTKRTVAVNLAGIEGALKTGKVAGGRRQIKGRELNYDVVANAGALADKIKDAVAGYRRRRHQCQGARLAASSCLSRSQPPGSTPLLSSWSD